LWKIRPIIVLIAKIRLDYIPFNDYQWPFYRGYFCPMFYPFEGIFAKKSPIIEVIFSGVEKSGLGPLSLSPPEG